MPYSVCSSYAELGKSAASAAAIAWARLRTLWLPKAGRNCSWCAIKYRAQRSNEASLCHFSRNTGSGQPEPPCGRDFVVPVGSLDQPDRDRRTAALDPVAEHAQLVFGVAVIGLHDDADIGPVAKLGLVEHAAKQLVGKGPIRVLFHIDVNISPQLASRAEDRPQPAG